MKYAIMILRPDGSFDFYSRLRELHDRENIQVSYQYFQRQLKETRSYELKDGSRVFRKVIRRGT
jgi:hypothetical protein